MNPNPRLRTLPLPYKRCWQLWLARRLFAALRLVCLSYATPFLVCNIFWSARQWMLMSDVASEDNLPPTRLPIADDLRHRSRSFAKLTVGPFASRLPRMQSMLPTLEQHASSRPLLDEEDAQRLARWAEVVAWLQRPSKSIQNGCCTVFHPKNSEKKNMFYSK